mgnify:CR=1 FL=1
MTGPEPGRSRPIQMRVEPARLEAEVYESQHTVGAGEREKEAKRAQGLRLGGRPRAGTLHTYP